MSTLSVIIPTFNRRDYLIQCLNSVLTQTVAAYEIIVVDDGSTDGTREAVEAVPGVQLIRQDNGGPGRARNRGASAATGSYLAFLDSDDLWHPWSLQAIVTLIERYGHPALLFARFEDFSGLWPSNCREELVKGRMYADFLASAKDGCYAGAGMMVVRREVFCTIEGFDEERMNAEDHDLALRLGTAPGFVQVKSPIIVSHRIHEGNEMMDLGRTLSGITRLVDREVLGDYPGNRERQHQRREVITRHARPAIIAALRSGKVKVGLRLYRRTLAWNTRAGRFGFVFGAPIIGLLAVFRPGRD